MSGLETRFMTKTEDYIAWILLRSTIWGNGSVDFNGYDRQSRSVGTFDDDDNLTLGLRIVSPSTNNHYDSELRNAVEAIAPSCLHFLEASPPCRIAAEESFAIADRLDQLEEMGRKYVEFGRLTGNPKHKASGSIFRLMRFAIREVMKQGYCDAFASCRPEHTKTWERFSFFEIPGIGSSVERYTGMETVCLHASWTDSRSSGK